MPYAVELAARAARDLEILYLKKNATESHAAARWYNTLEEAIYTLARDPHRCPVAPEAQRAKRKLRQLLFGKKPHVYRIIFEVQEQQQRVWVLTIRHEAMRKVRKSDIA
jgi:toxin ParE1/3/4